MQSRNRESRTTRTARIEEYCYSCWRLVGSKGSLQPSSTRFTYHAPGGTDDSGKVIHKLLPSAPSSFLASYAGNMSVLVRISISTTVPYTQKSSRQKAHHRGALKDRLLAPNYRPRTRLHAMPCNIGSAKTRTSRDPVTLASLRKTTGIAIRVPKRGHIFTDVSKVGHEGDPRAMAVCR